MAAGTMEPGWKLNESRCQFQLAQQDNAPRCGRQKIEVWGLMLCPSCDKDAIRQASER